MASFVVHRRGRLTLVLTAFTALTVAIAGTFYTSRALATSDDNPYVVPLATDTNPDPNIFETTIKAEPHTIFNIGTGISANMLTFNGTVPGPELRLHVGETVIVHFENHIAHDTGIHWHGIELANASDGTPLTQNQVPPNGKYLYKFTVTRPGIYWYHPHHHSSTNQVFKGLYGTIVVTDPKDTQLVNAGVLPTAVQTRTLALSDVSICGSSPNTGALLALCETSPIDEDGAPRGPYAAGDVPNIQPGGTGGRVNEGLIVLTNGKNVGGRAGTPNAPGALAAGASTLDVQAGQPVRLQILNTATVRFFRLGMTGRDTNGAVIHVPLVRVGGENGLLDHAVIEGGVESNGFDWQYGDGEVLLGPGDRVDVVAAFPVNAAGVFSMWEQDLPRTGTGPAGIPTVPVAHFNVTGTSGSYTIGDGTPILTAVGGAVETLGAATGALIDPSTFSPAKTGFTGPNIPDVRLTNTGSSLGINSVIGLHDFPGVDYIDVPHAGSARYATLGDVLQLTVTNATGAHHPFHLHGFSIQPISLTDVDAADPPDGNAPPGTGPEYVYPYREFRDTIDVPAGYTLTFRVRLDDRPQLDGATMGGGVGRWVFHCHIFFHASFGMISEFDVVAPSGNERPYVNADGVSVEGNSGDSLVMHGTYKDPDGDTPIALTASTGSVSDDGDGKHWTWTATAASSQLVYVTATDPSGLTGQAVFAAKINQPPVLTVPGPQTQDYHDNLAFGISATDPDGDPIVLSVTGLPASLAFVDNGNGTGTVSGTLTVIPAVYVATFSASDGHNPAVKKTVQITVTKEETTLTYTGPTVILNGGNVTLSAVLKEDGLVPIAGRTVSFTLGAQGCSAATGVTGVASCSVLVNSALGEAIAITSTFAGDAFYLGSVSNATAIVFAFPSRGAFAVGNVSAAGGGTVTWWGSQWPSANVLSGGPAPSAFKGFAGTVSLPTGTPPSTCGAPWSTSGGNSPPPTLVVPSYMGVLVTSNTNKSGNIINGNTVKIVVVKVGSGYQPNSGNTGTGTIVGTYCQ
ncbi:MAG: multicopper oxidase domain-containing protein [Vicinamibacterales bacterium]